MTAPRRLETQRLVLRMPTTADTGEMYARYAADAEVTRFLGWPRHRSVDDTRAFLEFSDAQWRDGDRSVAAVHFNTDHSYSDHRIALESVVIDWLSTQSPH